MIFTEHQVWLMGESFCVSVLKSWNKGRYDLDIKTRVDDGKHSINQSLFLEQCTKANLKDIIAAINKAIKAAE